MPSSYRRSQLSIHQKGSYQLNDNVRISSWNSTCYIPPRCSEPLLHSPRGRTSALLKYEVCFVEFFLFSESLWLDGKASSAIVFERDWVGVDGSIL
jgi:hypothetical protein